MVQRGQDQAADSLGLVTLIHDYGQCLGAAHPLVRTSSCGMLRYGEDRAHIDLSRPYIIGIQGAAISNTGLSQKRSSPLLAKNGYDRKPAADFDHLDYLASVGLPDRQHRRSPCQRPLSILVARMTDLNIFPIRISMPFSVS